MEEKDFIKFVKQLAVFGVAADGKAVYTMIDDKRHVEWRGTGGRYAM